MTPTAGHASIRHSFDTIVVAEGTIGCAHAAALIGGDGAVRDLADAVHAFCALHGSTPNIVERAIAANGAAPIQGWLRDAAMGFDEERQLLATLTAAIGPRPSTPRAAQAEAAMTAQQHALATLASSERAGCAVGAALALLLDWHVVRDVLGVAAYCAGVVLLPPSIPLREEIISVASTISANPAHARALSFGAQQLALQHRGLWQLLASRMDARNAL
ncbi:hypothetical protein [Sphingomonas sp.]|uniref:DUF6975 family protein n=1 Tax=Sphingomonas sp. TaxID=28214 RepID=UPI00262E3E2C|nr:hypothetical protein [Sphingomonas sp.]MDF2495922.1 hypothetical protein [Sphingomonas sp.]